MRRAALIPVLALMVFAGCGHHHHPHNAQTLNGHQSAQQKRVKGIEAQHVLSAIQATRSPVDRAKACAYLPEGYGKMGVCAAAPAYLHKVYGHIQLGLGGALGIDTSHWDHCGRALFGPSFWIVAVGDGNYIDPCAGPLYASLRRAGIPRSTYYFTRQYIDPIYSADHYAHLIRQMGATDSLAPDGDHEDITSCVWIYRFDVRLKADLHLRTMLDYSSPGLWPGCRPSGDHPHVAAYGPIGQQLPGFPGALIQQTSDGNVGPYPHCLAVCGDIDVTRGPFSVLNRILVHSGPPPLPAKYNRLCSTLDGITWLRHTRGHISHNQHDTAVQIRRLLRGSHIGCSRQPHSYATRGNGTRGNLA